MLKQQKRVTKSVIIIIITTTTNGKARPHRVHTRVPLVKHLKRNVMSVI